MEEPDRQKDLLEKHKQVTVWLEKVLPGKEIPQYEVSNQTVDTLIILMKRNNELDRLTEIINDDLERQIKEYKVEASRLRNILSEVGLPLNTLSLSGTTSVNTLSEIAIALDLKNTKKSSYFLSFTDISDKVSTIQNELETHQRQASNLSMKTNAALLENNSLTKIFETLEQQSTVQGPLMEKKSKETNFIKHKAKQYDQDRKSLQESVNQTGVTEDIYHESLVQIAEELNDIREQIKPLKSKLNSYHSLPADMSLGRVKIEEAKHELEKLEAQLYSNIEILNL